MCMYFTYATKNYGLYPSNHRAEIQAIMPRKKITMNETKIQVKPNLEMHEIYMHIYKSDWTVLSADKAEGKMSIKLFSRFV